MVLPYFGTQDKEANSHISLFTQQYPAQKYSGIQIGSKSIADNECFRELHIFSIMGRSVRNAHRHWKLEQNSHPLLFQKCSSGFKSPCGV